jgi:hypothetical protein
MNEIVLAAGALEGSANGSAAGVPSNSQILFLNGVNEGTIPFPSIVDWVDWAEDVYWTKRS